MGDRSCRVQLLAIVGAAVLILFASLISAAAITVMVVAARSVGVYAFA